MAEVEDHAEVAFALIGFDDFGLDADAGGDDVLEGFRVAVEDGCLLLLEEVEEVFVADDGGLDGFLEAGAEFLRREGGKSGDVGVDG